MLSVRSLTILLLLALALTQKLALTAKEKDTPAVKLPSNDRNMQSNKMTNRHTKLHSNTTSETKKVVKAEGLLESAGITTWQYGTHILTMPNGKTYALTSDTIKLNKFEGKRVHIEGSEIAGYPVENGPPYVKVEQLTVLK